MNAKLKKNGLFYASLLCTVAVCVAIFCFSAQNAEESSGVSRGFTEKLLAIFGEKGESLKEIAKAIDGFIRKAAHFSIYAALGFFAGFSAYFGKNGGTFCTENKTSVFLTMLALPLPFCVLYAAGDECHQLFVEGRACRLFDVLIDTAGSFCGILAGFVLLLVTAYLLRKKKRKKSRKRSRKSEEKKKPKPE